MLMQSACLRLRVATGWSGLTAAAVGTEGLAPLWQATVALGVTRRMCSATGESADAEGGDSASEAARALGLDLLPAAQLQGMLENALPRHVPGGRRSSDRIWDVPPRPPRERKLTYGDLQGYKEVLEATLEMPFTHDLPTAPVVSASRWLDVHMQQAQLDNQPRSGFYAWRVWAAQHLPQEQLQALLNTEAVMADDTQRAALLKQAKHELARLWDWQHRRAALGLSPDIPAAAASAADAAGGQQQQLSMTAATAVEDADADVVAVSKDEAVRHLDAAAATEEMSGMSSSSSSSSSSDEEASAASVLSTDNGVLGVLLESGALPAASTGTTAAAQAGTEAAAALDAANVLLANDASLSSSSLQQQQQLGALGAPAWMATVEDVADRKASSAHTPPAAGHARKASAAALEAELQHLQIKLQHGEATATRGQRRMREGHPMRRYQPVAHEDDLFLPTKTRGSVQLVAALADRARTVPVDPVLVTRQAVAVAEAARRAAAGAADGSGGMTAAASAAEWSMMPLLDRGVLHAAHLKEVERRQAARPKRAMPWALTDDGYVFDLRLRPPTPALDRVTSYLEVRYADVLMRRDAARSLRRRMAAAAVSAVPGEAAETPPAALFAAASLSAAERSAVTSALDELLGSGQYKQYRDAVLQLYCDGLVSWGELQACWGAAQAGEELAAAERGPPSELTADRDLMFDVLTGRTQLQLVEQQQPGSTSSDSTASAAARAIWDAAASTLQEDWVDRARTALLATSGAAVGGGGGGAAPLPTAAESALTSPVSYQEAAATWQQLVLLSGVCNAPTLDEVLLQGGGSSSSGSSGSGSRAAAAAQDDALRERLQHLQAGLRNATGLGIEPGHPTPAHDDVTALAALAAALASPEQTLREHFDSVARSQHGDQQQLPASAGAAGSSAWQQMWHLIDSLAAQLRAGVPQKVDADGQHSVGRPDAEGLDASVLLSQYVDEADAVPLAPPPYPGARRILRWEQRIVLGPGTGREVSPEEVKVRLRVSAAELAAETGLSDAALQHILAVAGNRYNPDSGVLTLGCDRFPTREENRRWCLEVLHRLLHEGQARHPSKHFLLGGAGAGAAAAAAAAMP